MNTGREEPNKNKEVSTDEEFMKKSIVGKTDKMNFSNIKHDKSSENEGEDFFKLKESSNSRHSQQNMSNDGGRIINTPL
jgi:hypothetical protein